MSGDKTLPPEGTNREVGALIEALHDTEKRLEELTAGEVDTVTNRVGNLYVLRRAQDQLRDAEATKQAAILNALPAHIALLDSQGIILSVNEAWRQFAIANELIEPDYGIGLNYLQICDAARGANSDEAPQVWAGIRSVLEGRASSYSVEYPCHSPGEQRWFLMTVTPLADDLPHGVVAMHLNITARKTAEEQIQRHAQLYAALSECSKAIVKCTGEDELFIEISRAAVQFGGMKMAWVGLADSKTRMMRPVASFGDDNGYLKDLNISVDIDSPFGQGPTGTTFRKDQPYWCQDIQNDGITLPWRSKAVHAGMASAAALPLHRNGMVVGTFNLYSGKVGSFDALARDLLVEMARDISFALDNFDHESRRKQVEEAIKLSNTILQTQQETSLDAILVVDTSGKIISHNQQFIDLWKLSPQLLSAGEDAPVLQSVIDQVENPEAFSARVQYLYEHHDDKSREEVRLKDGRTVDRYSSPITGAEGQYYGRVWYFRDITERKKAQDRIAYLNLVYAMLSGINTLIVRMHDRDELFREACRIAVEAGGFRMSMLCILDRSTMKIVPVASAGKDENLLTSIKDVLSSSEHTSKTLVAQAIRGKTVLVSNDSKSDPRVIFGRKYAESGISSMAIFPLIVANEAVGAFTLYASEIEFFHKDELKLLAELAGDIAFAMDHLNKQERLNYLAFYDPLTGLANRSLFLERVTQYIRSTAAGHKIAVFLIDVDRFKNINDSLGRQAGDELLKQIAGWLQNNVGDAGLLARIDSDHFAIVMPEVRPDGNLARLVEKKMAASLEHQFPLNDATFRIATKIGVALFPDDGTDADILLKNAEAALKKAKSSGERFLFHTQKMTEAVAGKLALENQLRRALDNEEFVLHYQPKVNLVSGRMTGAEALIRWKDPASGLVPPGHFIPILEETGLIYEVGRWALRKAIADYLRWRDSGLPTVRIAVNVSPLQLSNHGFVAEIGEVIGINKNAAAGLELEITESLIMEDVKHNITSLQTIRDMGVTIAIDDFGTGFSSLSYLAQLPVDTLKIDRAFVTDMTAGPERLALVATIINLAHSLKLTVVAEGVETEEQARLLRLLACDEMQGFLFSKPVPGEIFEARFLAHFTPGDAP